jgi:hypothetical protein
MENRTRRGGWEWWAIGGLLLLLASSAAFYHVQEQERRRPITVRFYFNDTVGTVLSPGDRMTVLHCVRRPVGYPFQFEPVVSGLEIQTLGECSQSDGSITLTLTLLATPAQAEKVRKAAEQGPPLIIMDE